MKKKSLIAALLATVLLFGNLYLYAAEDSFVNVVFNGEMIEFSGIEPVIVNGRVFVPVEFFEQFGFRTMWRHYQLTESGESDLVASSVFIDRVMYTAFVPNWYRIVYGPDPAYYPNWRELETSAIILDVAPFIQYEMFMMPLRVILENANFIVEWDDKTRTVIVTR